jgi:hypothetical protein
VVRLAQYIMKGDMAGARGIVAGILER